MSVLRWSVVGVLAVGTGVGLGVTAHLTLPESPFVKGLFVGERRLPPAGEVGDWMQARREAVQGQRLVLRAADLTEELTYADLGVDLDLAATQEAALAVGHRGSLLERVREAQAARRGEIDVPLVYRVDETKARSALERIATRIHKDPIEAKLDIVGKKKHPDVPGRDLDVEAALDAVLSADYSGVYGAVLDLPTTPVRAKITLLDLASVDIGKVVASHETTFATFGVGVGRSVNIARAASFVDGTIIPAGGAISFNELVGPRTIDRGFTWAPEIQGDELTTGVGGGTCQVSTTLFIAATFGALDIIERRNHSHPSAYAKLGLDATVSYGQVDLKIKNPFTFPVMLHAYLPQPGKIRVEILGGDPPADVSYTMGIGHSEDFVRRITVKPHLKPGTRIRRQKGSKGYDVTSVVTIRWKDGRVEERTYFSGYRPAPEVFWVAPGFDESELPPLPTGAKGVEGRVAERDVYSEESPL